MITDKAIDAAWETMWDVPGVPRCNATREEVRLALEAAAPYMLLAALPMDRDEARYVDISDPMWEEHQRTVSPKCTCEYTKIQNGLWKTIAIRRDPDKDCATHE